MILFDNILTRSA